MKLALLRRYLSRTPILAALGVGTLVFLVTLAVRHGQLLESLEFGAYDAYLRHRPTAGGASPPVVIVAVSEQDIQSLRTWPLRDETLARAVEILASSKPRAIGVDIYRDIPVPPGRDRLDQVLAENTNVVAVYRFQTGTDVGVSAPPSLEGTAQVGFNDVLVDAGGIVRRGLLFLSAERRQADNSVEWVTGYSLALQLALLYLLPEGIVPTPDPVNPNDIRLGKTTIAPLEAFDGPYVNMDARGYQFLLDYEDYAARFPIYSLMEVLNGEVDSDALSGKVVLIGVTAESVPDLFYTPFSRSLTADQQMPGVILHAHAVSQLIRFGLGEARPMAFLSDWGEAWWILAWSLAGALSALHARSTWRSVLIAAVGVGVLIVGSLAVFANDWWIPVVPPVLAWLVSAAVVTAYVANREAGQRRLLMNLFSRHVDPRLAASIWEQRDKFLEGGRPSSTELTATVMFVDLHGFTAVGEKLSPGDLMDWLNEYLREMTPIVMQHGGVVLRFIGDAIMAGFGVPLPRSSESEIREDAINAVRCALAMERKLIALNRRNRDLPMYGMRVGICTGPMVGGSMGDGRRLEYNLHGDSVNTAARLEGFEKRNFVPDFTARPCRILIGAPTHVYLGGAFATETVGTVALRGKQRTIAVYRVIGEEERDLGVAGKLAETV